MLIRGTLQVAKRELRALFTTPVFWIVTGLFFGASALVFLGLVVGFSNPELRQTRDISGDITISVVTELFWVIHYFLMIMAPMITMRALAEERRLGTLSLVQTLPVPEWSIAAGKFIANTLALFAFVALTLVFPLLTEWISDPYWPVVLSCYAALFLSAMAYTAIGIFFSSLTESQVVAAVLTYVFLFGMIIVAQLAEAFTLTTLMQITKHLMLMEHVDGFLDGNIAVLDFMYFIIVAAVFLFFSVRVLESSRWRN